jgi:hypothetical protein
MGFLTGLIFMIALPAGIAWAICAGLRVLAPASARRFRIALAAGLAGLVPILIPLIAILFTASARDELLIALAAVLVGGVVIGLLIGLPVALLATRHDRPGEPPARTFE